ncbi:hypothetical protein RCL1_005514 [Eukaryota sp. TZLM3-RCL]
MSLQGVLEPSTVSGVVPEETQEIATSSESFFDKIDSLIAQLGQTDSLPIPTSRSFEVDFLLRLVFVLCTIGFPVFSMTDLLTPLASFYDLRLYINASPNLVTVTVFGERLNRSSVYIVPLYRNIPGPFQLDLIVEYTALIRRASAGLMSIEESYRGLFEILSRPRNRSLTRYVFAGALSSSTLVGLFPNSRYEDFGIAAIGGAITQVLLFLGGRRYLISRFLRFYEFTVPFLVTFYIAVVSLIVRINVESVIISSIVWILPGVSLTLAAMELAAQYISLGSSRLVFTILIVFLLAFGIYAGLLLLTLFGTSARYSDGYGMSPFFALIWVPLISIGFALLLNTPFVHFPGFIIAGAVAYTLEILLRGVVEDFAVVIASFCVAALGHLYSFLFKVPTLVFTNAGILMLVPGSLAVLGFVQVLGGQLIDGIGIALQVLIISAQIALGVLAAGVIFNSKYTI